jgi:hypothetical protein
MWQHVPGVRQCFSDLMEGDLEASCETLPESVYRTVAQAAMQLHVPPAAMGPFVKGLMAVAAHLPLLSVKDKKVPRLDSAVPRVQVASTAHVLPVLQEVDAYVQTCRDSHARVRNSVRQFLRADDAVATATLVVFAAAQQHRAHAQAEQAAIDWEAARQRHAEQQERALNRLHLGLLITNAVVQRYLTLRERSALKHGLPVISAR